MIFVVVAIELPTVSFRDSIRMTVHERFVDVDENETEGIQALEKMTFIRWIFFVFGALGPGIKLMAMGGVPWTKAFGIIYLLSFSLVEALIIFSWRDEGHEPVLEPLDAEGVINIESERLDRESISGTFLPWLYSLAQLVLVWAICDIWNGFSPFSFDEMAKARRWGAYSKFIHSFAILVSTEGFPLAVVAASVRFTFFPLSGEYGRLTRHWYWRVSLRIFACAVLVLFVFMWVYLRASLRIMFDYLFIVALIAPLFVLHRYMPWIGKRWPRLARNIFLTFPEDAEPGEQGVGGPQLLHLRPFHVCLNDPSPQITADGVTFLCFIMFLYTTVLSVVWYAFRYNPEGTVNRGWTGILG
jgi:hypothetical protein